MSQETQTIELPFDCQVMDSEPQEISNPYTGESCMLTPEAIAVYDTLKGAEMFGLHSVTRKGLNWFRKYYPKEYMILLD